METLTDTDKHHFQDSNGYFTDACSWRKVVCDEDDNIKTIEMDLPDERPQDSSINMSFIPPQVVEFRATASLRGTLETSTLPTTLAVLNVQGNRFSGTVDFTSLPATIVELDLSCNQFHGSCVLNSLPPVITIIRCNNNKLSGSLDLTKLPSNMQNLYLSNNQFTGEINLEHLPAEMLVLSLARNQLSGSVVLNKLPEGITELNLRRNKFSGEICLDNYPESLKTLSIEFNAFCGKFTFLRALSHHQSMHAGFNKFDRVAVIHSANPANSIFSVHVRYSGITTVLDENGVDRTSDYTYPYGGLL